MPAKKTATGPATARAEHQMRLDAQKSRPGYCPDCGQPRADRARNVVADYRGRFRAVASASPYPAPPCGPCDIHHHVLVVERAEELTGWPR